MRLVRTASGCHLSSFICHLSSVIFVVLPIAAHAAPISIYDAMREITRKEALVDATNRPSAELTVRKFVSKQASALATLPTEVNPALGNDKAALCSKKAYRPDLGWDLRCPTFLQEIADLTRRTQRTRTLGRDLLSIAASYEVPLREWSLNGPESVARLWRAGDGAMTGTATGAVVTVVNLPANSRTMQAAAALASALNALKFRDAANEQNDEQFVGAVWRYRYGYLQAARETLQPNPGRLDGTPMQYLRHRFPPVEQALRNLHLIALETLRNAARTDLPGHGTLYRVEAPAAIAALLPDNVNLWIEAETIRTGNSAQPVVFGSDAGLDWRFPVEPVLPSLCVHRPTEDFLPERNTCVPILAGSYPVAPSDGTGLCGRVSARGGYLCRPMEEARCDTDAKGRPNAITLAQCRAAAPSRNTFSGPDACMETNWRLDAKAFDPKTQCKVKFTCFSADDKSIPYDAKTYPKDADGVIAIKYRGNANALLILHELTHAKQLCNLPIGFTPFYAASKEDKRTECCRMEAEAYRLQFNAMGESGYFDKASPLKDIFTRHATPFNPETMTQLATDVECRHAGFGSCPASFSFPYKEDHPLIEEVKRLLTQNKAGTTCYEEIPGGKFLPTDPPEKLKNPRIQSQVREILAIGNQVCDPNRSTRYRNTVGGNLCFFDQCLEQSLERGRLIPGRMTVGASEPAFPFDGTGKPSPALRTLVGSPLPPLSPLPPYRPELLLRNYDAAFCQINGLPPGTPPAVCAFQPNRALSAPQGNSVGTAFGIGDQREEAARPAVGLEELSEGIGIRIGNTLYADALRTYAEALSFAIGDANAMLKNFTKVQITRTMCPLNGTNDPTIYAPVSSSAASAASFSATGTQ